MKIMKVFASCAMVGALTVVCASGVLAASKEDFCSTYTVSAEDETVGSVTVTAADAEYEAAGDYTVLVFPKTVEEDGETVDLTESTTIADSYIKQIDQNSTGTFTLNFSGLADGEYCVRLGGAQSGYVYDTFTVGEEVVEDTATPVTVTVNHSISNAFSTTGVTTAIVTPETTLESGKALLYDGNPVYYTQYTIDSNVVTKYIVLAENFDSSKFSVADGTMTQIVYGNFVDSNENNINLQDLSEMLNIALDNSRASTSELKLIADINADGLFNLQDLSEELNMALDASIIPSAAKK